MISSVAHRVTHNVPRLCEGWALEVLSFKLAQSLIEFQMLNLALQPSFCKTAVQATPSVRD